MGRPPRYGEPTVTKRFRLPASWVADLEAIGPSATEAIGRMVADWRKRGRPTLPNAAGLDEATSIVRETTYMAGHSPGEE